MYDRGERRDEELGAAPDVGIYCALFLPDYCSFEDVKWGLMSSAMT